jgi:hypothetical protein
VDMVGMAPRGASPWLWGGGVCRGEQAGDGQGVLTKSMPEASVNPTQRMSWGRKPRESHFGIWPVSPWHEVAAWG